MILRQSRAIGTNHGALHCISDGGGFRMVEPGPDSSPEAMSVKRSGCVDAWRASVTRQAGHL